MTAAKALVISETLGSSAFVPMLIRMAMPKVSMNSSTSTSEGHITSRIRKIKANPVPIISGTPSGMPVLSSSSTRARPPKRACTCCLTAAPSASRGR